MAFAAATVLASFARLWHAHRAVSFDLEALRNALGRAPTRTTLRALRDSLEAELPNWEAELVGAVLDAPSADARTVLVNQVLRDAESQLAWGAHIRKTAPRVASAGGLCVMFWSVAGQGWTLREVVSVVAWTAAGVIASISLARESERVVSEHRRAIDAWVERLLCADLRHSL